MKNFSLLILFSVFLFAGCSEKESELDVIQDITADVYSFREEIIVEDENGINTAKYAVYSDDESILKSFISNHSFGLVVETSNFNQILEQSILKSSDHTSTESNEDDFVRNQEPRIVLELLDDCLEDEAFNHLLQIESKPNSLKAYSINYAVGMESKKNQIGVVHSGLGYEFMVNFRYKSKWYKSWSNVTYNQNGELIKYVYPNTPYNNYSWFDWGSYYKRQVVVFPHLYQYSRVNYIFVHWEHELDALVARIKR